MTNLLEIKALCVNVDGQDILHDLDLTIPNGEVHTLLGPNGSGKTTLMMTIIGYPEYRVTNGQILFDGKDITTLDITERARLGIGISQQRPPTISGVKLKQVLDFIIANARQPVPDINELARAYKIEPFLDRDINAGLSGGEIKSSELFQLLIARPRFVMMDEPDSGVDLEAINIVGQMMNEIFARHHTIRTKERRTGLIITHTGNILDYIHADKAHLILDGYIGYTGNPHILLDQIREHGYGECARCELWRCR